MGSIEKQPNGRYRARYRDRRNRSRSQTFATRRDAQAFLERNGIDLRSGDWTDPVMKRSVFDDWASTWWATTVKLRPATRRGYHQLLHNHVLPYFGGRPLGSIDYLDVEQFISAKLGQGLSPKMVRDAVSVVSLIMKCAIRANARRDNPAAGQQIPVPRRKIRTGDVLSMEDVHRMIEHVPDSYRAAVWLLVLTGIRPSELCGLRISSVNFSRRGIHVTEALVPIHRFGDQPYGLAGGPTKTDAGDRIIPLPGWLIDELAAGIATRTQAGEVVGPDSHLFVMPKGGPLERDKFRQKVIRPALRAAGLPETIRTYDLRHSHASLLIDQGANVLAVAQRMGHSDPAVTLRVYGHLFAGVQERLTEALDDLRAKTAPAAARPKVVPIDGRRESS